MNDNGHNSGQRPQPNRTNAPQGQDGVTPLPRQDGTSAASARPEPDHAPATGTTHGQGGALAGSSFCRVITAAASLHIPEADAEAMFAQLKTGLPARSVRRMSRLGLMLSRMIEQVGVDAETLVLYASAFGEGRTLETYLSSFPQASPLGFQSSIHPGGVEQALIFRQQPIREFFPITASESLPLALFRTLEQCSHAKRVLLLGGEEHASWLTQKELAAGDNFAFALVLEPPTYNAEANEAAALQSATSHAAASQQGTTSQQAEQCRTAQQDEQCSSIQQAEQCHIIHRTNALGMLCADETPPADAQAIDCGETLADLCAAIQARRPMRFAHPDEGCWLLEWHP